MIELQEYAIPHNLWTDYFKYCNRVSTIALLKFVEGKEGAVNVMQHVISLKRKADNLQLWRWSNALICVSGYAWLIHARF